MSFNHTEIIRHLPEKTGVYQFIDNSGSIIYVGKAKNLKKRVSSYFTRNQSGKTTAMISRAAGLKHIVVESESEALLLENNLIKKLQPRYNILLKDDKTYPWICIKNEPYPRVFSTRNVIKDGSVYYGPYTSGLMVKTLLELIRQLYKLRTCTLSLTKKNIKSGKFKICLEYHLGNCRGPCEDKQSEDDYLETIKQIKSILKGNISTVIDYLKRMMMALSGDLHFEEAQAVKEKIELLSRYRSRSTIVSTLIRNADVFSYKQDQDRSFVGFLKVVDGAVVQAYILDLKSRMDEERESLLGFAITELRQRFSSDSPEIIVPFKPDILFQGIRYTVPLKGDKIRLLELASRNAEYYRLEQMKRKEEYITRDRTARNLEKLKSDLHLAELPLHIECFDNSNTAGMNPVAACVVFRKGKPSKKEYRHFNIKTVSGPDDFASMEEIIFRRYKRLTEENKKLPQLIIIDGGKGQLSSAIKGLEKLDLKDKVAVVGIAKKLEEIYFPGDKIPLYIDKNSVSLKIIQQLRNEAHRFGVKFHRSKRSSEMKKSELDHIRGIGPRTKELLIREIGSVEKIRRLTYQELSELIGSNKASLLFKYFEK